MTRKFHWSKRWSNQVSLFANPVKVVSQRPIAKHKQWELSSAMRKTVYWCSADSLAGLKLPAAAAQNHVGEETYVEARSISTTLSGEFNVESKTHVLGFERAQQTCFRVVSSFFCCCSLHILLSRHSATPHFALSAFLTPHFTPSPKLLKMKCIRIHFL